jgi:hypothetical protein
MFPVLIKFDTAHIFYTPRYPAGGGVYSICQSKSEEILARTVKMGKQK